MQLGVNAYKGFMPAEPIAVYFTQLTRRCREHDVEGFEAEMRAFLSGPLRSLAEKMTGFTGFERYERGGDAGSEA
jgi:hypothetical protein